MKILLLLLFLGVFSNFAFSQKVIIRNSIHDIESLNKRIDKIEKLNDSLNKELYYYRAKEDFYSASVSNQTSHFESLISNSLTIIIAGLGLFSFISYSFINEKFKQLTNQFEDENKKLKEVISGFEDKSHIVFGEVNDKLGGVYYTMGSFFKGVSARIGLNMYTSFMLRIYLNSIDEVLLLIKRDKDKHFAFTEQAVERIYSDLNLIIKDLESFIDGLTNSNPEYGKIIEMLGSESLKDLIYEILHDKKHSDKKKSLKGLILKIENLTINNI